MLTIKTNCSNYAIDVSESGVNSRLGAQVLVENNVFVNVAVSSQVDASISPSVLTHLYLRNPFSHRLREDMR